MSEPTKAQVEAAARAVQSILCPNDPFDEIDEEGRESHRTVARAALTAAKAAEGEAVGFTTRDHDKDMLIAGLKRDVENLKAEARLDPGEARLVKRPVAWRVGHVTTGWRLYDDEAVAYDEAERFNGSIQGLYVRDGTPNILDAPRGLDPGTVEACAMEAENFKGGFVTAIVMNPDGKWSVGPHIAAAIRSLTAAPDAG